MRIRRRFARAWDWSRVSGWFGGVWDRVRTALGPRAPGAGPAPAVEERGPRAEGRAPFWILAGSLTVGALLIGYLVAALVFFPAPIFAASRGVPNVIGQHADDATTALEQAGFVVSVSDERVSHPTLAAGTVVRQDPPPELIAPEGREVELVLSAGPQRVPVPDVAGYDAALARTLIESAGLTVGSVEQTQAPTPENVAVNTRPTAGATLLPGSRVTLVVSVGAPTIRVPDLIGLDLDSATVLLEARGLELGENYYQTNRTAPPGRIFFQTPAAGTLIAPGTPVNVRVAREEP